MNITEPLHEHLQTQGLPTTLRLPHQISASILLTSNYLKIIINKPTILLPEHHNNPKKQ